MYHVECIDIKETDPRYSYADYACLTANNMYNVANYYTRNLMTGLSKPEKQRTPNERDVIDLVRKSIPDINKSLQEKYKLKISNIRKDKKLTAAEKDKKIKKLKCAQFEMPTKEKWFAGYNLLDAVFKHNDNVDYRSNHIHLIQSAIKSCESAWKSFFNQLRQEEYNKKL